MTFNSHKRSDTKPDMIQHGSQPTALRSFNQTLLFQRPMIHFNPPRAQGAGFPLRFGHLAQACRPVFRRVVCGADAKYFNLSETFEPADCAIAAAQSGFRYRLQPALVDSDLPVRFEPRQKMPAKRAHQLQVFHRSIPAIAHIPVQD